MTEAVLSDGVRDPAFDLPEVRRLQSRVDAAAEKLTTRGVKPTVERIRVEIGGGSPNAVAPALRHWRLRRDRALGRAPDVIPSAVLDAARALYGAAIEAAARAAGTSQTELASQLEAERAKSATLAAELKHARRELETLRTERASLFEAAGHTHAELVQAQALATHCVAEARDVRARLDESQRHLGEARARIAVLESERARATASARPAGRAPKSKAARRAKRPHPAAKRMTPASAKRRSAPAKRSKRR